MEAFKFPVSKSILRLVVIISLFLLATTQARITNKSSVKNLVLPYNTYSQFRISGSGLGDEAIDDDLANVKLSIKITKSDALKNINNFDGFKN